jgi:PAS domain S-box-containing protein
MNLSSKYPIQQMARFFSGGIREGHTLEDQLRIRVINIVSVITIVVLTVFGSIAFAEGASTLGFADLSVALVFFITQIYLRMTGNYSVVKYFWVASTGMLFVYLFNSGGVDHTGHLWAYIFPLVAAFLLGARKGAFAISALMASIVLLWIVDYSQGKAVYPIGLVLRYVISSAIIAYATCYYEHFRHETLKQLGASNLDLDTQIAKLKEAEEALRKNQEELERRVEDRTNQLKTANKELRKEILRHKETEELLRSSEERYRLLFENSFDVVFSLDLQGKFVSMSPSIERILGYRPEELIGRPVFELNLTPEKYRALMFTEIMRVFGGDSISSSEYEVFTKNGEVKVAQVSAAPIRKQGNVVGMIVISRDITLQKKAQEELRKAHDELEMRVNQRTEELKRTNEALVTANRAKSDFLANMSHELRTPLNHIMGFTELIVDKQCGELNPVQEEYLNDVLQSSGHLLSLINDILDLSKVEAGKLDLQTAEVHLRMLSESGLGMVREQAIRHGIALSMDIEENVETIRADERKLKQILYNLLSNAVKFTPDGGLVTVTARQLSPRGGHWFTREGQSMRLPLDAVDPLLQREKLIAISVQDTGIGINGEDLQRIFAPFEQGDGSISRRYQGTGLGLSLTKRLVELHGGRIWAESAGKGKGSRFIFIMPG